MQKYQPKISVVTVCLNTADLIKKTIVSVLDQSYKGIEYIIIDGSSKDGTKDIVQSFGLKINKFISEPDTGIYNAMNKGIQAASGDLIIFLNAGDYYFSFDALSDATDKINIDKADIFFGRFIWHDPVLGTDVLSNHQATIYDWDLKNSNFPHPATFYKRSVFKEVGLFDENYKILGDYEWNARALVRHRIAFQYIEIITAHFISDGISNDKNQALRIKEYDSIIEEYFQPNWLYNFMKRLDGKHYSLLLKNLFATTFKKKLKRIY